MDLLALVRDSSSPNANIFYPPCFIKPFNTLEGLVYFIQAQYREGMDAKPVSFSALDNQIAIVFPNDLNANGTLFGGRVLELGDWICAVVAKRHSQRICVTLGLDSVRFLAPANSGDILVLKASVNRAWNTSMEVGLKVLAEDFRTLERKHIFSAFFTFVALDENGRPAKIPPVIPETEDQKRRYEEAEMRRAKRLKS